METLLTMDEEGAHIASDEIFKKFKGKKISASLISGLEGCHAKWVADTFVVDEVVKRPLDNPMTRGSLFHKVMEEVFIEEPANRTTELVKAKVIEVLSHPDYDHFKTNKDAVEWLKDAVNGYYKMGGKPQNVRVATIETPKGPKTGIEIFVIGSIGEAKRKVLGFVDRIIVDPKDETKVIVEDWKSGAKAKHWKSHTKDDEGWAEQRQQTIYSMILEGDGTDVSSARLIYPVAREVVKVDPNDEAIREKVVKDVEEADEKLDHLQETNTFEYSPSFLCAFCPVVKICPAAQVKMVGKLKTAYQEQPDPEELQEGIELL